jgi:predicted Zn finger-like uncharacterized protein
MILTCPSCGTQYVVKDGAIPPEGRQVRCASCKHSWHQDPEHGDAANEPPEAEVSGASAESAAPADEDQSLAEATLIDPRSGPEAEERAYEESLAAESEETGSGDRPEAGGDAFDEPDSAAAAGASSEDWNEPPEAEVASDDYSPFAAADEEEPAKRGALVPILVGLLVVAALAAAFWFLAPAQWKARLGIGAAGASPLALVTTHMDRQRLESGNELLTVTGRVINPTSEEQDVPPLAAQLRSRTGQIVYSWTIAPPARSLAPGGSASFNSAEVNVPAGGDELTITLGKPRA